MKPTVAVVGAGPAGLAAALEARSRGCEVVLIDEAPRPGGQIYRQADPRLALELPVPAGEALRKRALLDRFEAQPDDIEYRPATTAHALFPGPLLQVATQERSTDLSPGAVVVATGVSERAVPFPGWTLPGVLYAGGLQAMMKGSGVRPGGRIVIAGAGPLPVAVAAQLVRTGAEVVAVACLHALSKMAADPLALWAGRDVVAEGIGYLRTLRNAKVPILDGYLPIRAQGSSRLESLTMAKHDGRGQPLTGSERTFDHLDMAGISFGFTANSELVRIAGASTCYDPVLGGWLPVTDAWGATSVEGVYAAGDGAGLRGALVAEAEGRIVGAAAAAHAGGGAFDPVQPGIRDAIGVRSRHQRFQHTVRRTLALPSAVWSIADDDTIVCRCEGVRRGRLTRACADGHRTLDAIKRNTRAGMGWCGGRTCLQAVAAFCHEGAPTPDIDPMRARPVARPVTLAALAAADHDESS